MPRTRKKYQSQRRKPSTLQQRKSRQLSPRPTIVEMPAISEIDPQSSCPPPPPSYSGNWYNDCLRILGIR